MSHVINHIYKGNMYFNGQFYDEYDLNGIKIDAEEFEDLRESGFKYTLKTRTLTITVHVEGDIIINGKKATKMERIRAAKSVALNAIEDFDEDDYDYDYGDFDEFDK